VTRNTSDTRDYPVIRLMAQVHVFKSTTDLSNSVGDYILTLADKAISAKGSFTVAFSGGSLPAQVAPKLIGTDMSLWKVFLADERYVALDHPDSNYLALEQHIFDKTEESKRPKVVVSIDVSRSLHENCLAYAQAIKEHCVSDEKELCFDLILLGMGPDGHTASLFPNHALLDNSSDIMDFIEDSPKPPPQRITFTFPLINRAKNVAFVTTGDTKKVVLQKVLEEKPSKEFPSSLVKPKSGNLVWFIDAAAGALLKSSSI